MGALRRGFRALFVVGLALVPLAYQPATLPATAAGPSFRMGVPITVDPVRGAGEPILKADNHNSPYISGPGGTSTQTSWFWHSLDGGLTYSQLGPSAGHWLCPSGGGDSWLEYDKVSGELYVSDQEALVDESLGRLAADGHTLTAACAANSALSADRNFQAVIDSAAAPQYVANGNKPVAYMSWQCNACGTFTGTSRLAYQWSSNGTTWHVAEPGCASDAMAQLCLGTHSTGYQWHGSMVADPQTGYVYTALSCGSGGCTGSPSGTGIQFGIAVGKPGSDPTNIGKLASITYQMASDRYGSTPWVEPGSLFPVLTMDAAGTLYEMWAITDTLTSGTPPAQSGHVYYSYSKDKPNHTIWSPPTRIDSGPLSATSTMPWIAAGDAGKVAVAWLGTPTREYPSAHTPSKQWWPFVASITGADTASPAIQQDRVGIEPNHLGDICLQGTTCGATFPPGNRNMADFISVDINPEGSAQVVYAADAQQLGGATSLVKGVPVTMTARQVNGPKLIGGGTVSNPNFEATPRTFGVTDQIGDARVPPTTGANVANLDLTGSRLEWTGSDIKVHIPTTTLGSLVAPPGAQNHAWWMTTWRFGDKIYFAKAESVAGAAPTFTAGLPSSYDRPGLTFYTVPTLVDYRAGTPIQGAQVGNEWVLTVPAALVGNPKTGDILESVVAYTALDNGNPPFVTLGTGNVPTIVDASATYNHVLGTALAPGSNPTAGGPGTLPNTLGPAGHVDVLVWGLLALSGLSLAADTARRRRARRRPSQDRGGR